MTIQTNLLQNEPECAKLSANMLALTPAQLKALHDQALALVQLIRPMLGLEPVLTSRQVKRERYR